MSVTISPDHAVLHPVAVPTAPTSVVLVLHGGNEVSAHPVRPFDPAVLRLRPIARAVSKHQTDAAVYRLQFALRGWNGDGATALRDARWALTQLCEHHPGLPIVLVGHSMGARVALLAGGDPGVAGVVALTQWSPADDPADQLSGEPVVLLQGEADRTCPEPDTRVWKAKAVAAGARVHSAVLPHLGHTMLWRFWDWNRLTWEGVDQVLREAAKLSADRTDGSPPH